MKSNIFKFLSLIILSITLSCGHSTDIVESGTYTGKIIEVEADKSEIYVETSDGKVLELYFIDNTKLTEDGQVVPFSTLKEDQTVEVNIEKVGKRLDPLSVEIK